VTTSGSDRRAALREVAGLYAESLAKHGVDARAVGWGDEGSHRLRFDKLAEVLPAGVTPVDVADLGCGYGALFDYLDERLGPALTRYVGYEISSEMASVARERLRDPRAFVLETAEPTEQVDYSFACGPFNVKLDASERDWDAYVKGQLRALAATSRAGLAFNLLTTAVDWRDSKLFYADPDAYLEFCRRELSPDARLIDDYPLYEWTILVRLER
jgi:SAM-dependent methyltransferase